MKIRLCIDVARQGHGLREIAGIDARDHSPALVARDGKVQIPDGPGWGVTIDKGWPEKALYAKSELQ